MSYIDIGIVGICLLSGLFALVRGFVREVLSLVTWLAAAYAGVTFRGRLAPFIYDKIVDKIPSHADLVANSLAATIIFLVVLLVLSFFAGRISNFFLDSGIGIIDRGLGFVFGVGRGFLITVVAFMCFKPFLADEKEKWPEMVKNSRFLAPVETSANKIWALIPDNAVDLVQDRVNKALSAKEGNGK